MMKLLDITEKYGKATYAYPAAAYHVSENFRGKPVYTYELCIGCTACGVACPSNAIEVKLNEAKDKLVWQFDCGRCIFCGRCDEVCPTRAINLSKEYELAVKFDKSSLIQRGELEVEKCTCCGKPFTSKRLLEYVISRMDKGTVQEQRLKESEIYVHICPDCKRNKAVENMTTNKEGAIR